jgi:hypothetical protein
MTEGRSVNKHVRKVLVPFVGALACHGLSADAQTPSPAPSAVAASPTIAGWDELIESLRDLPARMLAKLPESERSDPQLQQEVGRLLLEALASSTLDALGGDGDHPTFLPQIGQTLNVGQPNPDTVYRVARITPAEPIVCAVRAGRCA